jgi:hypothetical protein
MWHLRGSHEPIRRRQRGNRPVASGHTDRLSDCFGQLAQLSPARAPHRHYQLFEEETAARLRPSTTAGLSHSLLSLVWGSPTLHIDTCRQRRWGAAGAVGHHRRRWGHSGCSHRRESRLGHIVTNHQTCVMLICGVSAPSFFWWVRGWRNEWWACFVGAFVVLAQVRRGNPDFSCQFLIISVGSWVLFCSHSVRSLLLLLFILKRVAGYSL